MYSKEQFKKLEAELVKMGYRKYNQNHKREDFSYFKPFYEEKRDEYGDKILKYQVGFFVYDFSKYPQYPNQDTPISVTHECYVSDEMGGARLTRHYDEVDIERFEEYCKNFYNFEVNVQKGTKSKEK